MTPARKNSKKSQSTQKVNPATSDELLLDSIIPYQINRLSYTMNRLLDQELRQEGLSMAYWRVMAVLDFNDSASVNEMAEYAMIQQSTLSRMLQRMETEGYVEYRRIKSDRRVRHIHLTAKGRKKYNTVRDITLRHVRRIVSGFSKSERSQLMKFIKRMDDNVQSLSLPD